MRVDRRALSTIPLLGALALAGCDAAKHYEHATVHGTVSYKGKPLTFGTVLFVPVTPPEEGLPQPASGDIQEDGSYVLKSQEDPGAVLGEHKVVVVAVKNSAKPTPAADPADGPPSPAPMKGSKSVSLKSEIPGKYSDPISTPLTRKVEPGDNTFDIEITD